MKKERKLIPIVRTVSYGLVGWILSVTIISAPLISCQQAFTKPQVYTSVSQLSGDEKLSTAEKGDASSSVVSNVQVGETERIASSDNGITISVDKDNSSVIVVDENERQIYRKLYPRTMRTADEDSFSETEVSSEGGLDFVLDTSVPLNDVDMLVYNKVKQNISSDSRLDSEAIASNVDSLIDLSDLESNIQEKLSSNERLISLSRSAQDELTEEDIEAITQAVQETMDEKGPILATQILPAAEDMDSAGNEVALKTLNSPVEGIEAAASRTMANAKKNRSRSVSSNPTVVTTREKLK
jgi:hypothetical protein